MFFRHFGPHSETCHRRGPDFRGFGRHGRGGGGPFGGREGRMFDNGELRLVILALIAEKPRHGYEVIKELGERVGDDYSPSPGVVYPTLTLLEDMGFAIVNTEAGARKLYAVTPEGQKHLDENRPQIDAIFARFAGAGQSEGVGAGSVLRAMLNLRAAVRLRLAGRQATREQIQAVVDALDAAAKTIERL